MYVKGIDIRIEQGPEKLQTRTLFTQCADQGNSFSESKN